MECSTKHRSVQNDTIEALPNRVLLPPSVELSGTGARPGFIVFKTHYIQ